MLVVDDYEANYEGDTIPAFHLQILCSRDAQYLAP